MINDSSERLITIKQQQQQQTNQPTNQIQVKSSKFNEYNYVSFQWDNCTFTLKAISLSLCIYSVCATRHEIDDDRTESDRWIDEI